MKMEQIECSETSAYKIQTPGNHPEENIQNSNSFSISRWDIFYNHLKWNVITFRKFDVLYKINYKHKLEIALRANILVP
jgi:hypothetical protein